MLSLHDKRGNFRRWLCRCDCGNEKIIVGNSLKTGNTTSCGSFHKEMIGEMFTNPNLTEEDRRINRNREVCVPVVHLWRKAVYKRDRYHCQACSCLPGKRLAAHHKDGWDWCKERRLDESNGVSACTECHKEFHGLYGWGGNTEAQWDEFVIAKREALAA